MFGQEGVESRLGRLEEQRRVERGQLLALHVRQHRVQLAQRLRGLPGSGLAAKEAPHLGAHVRE